MALVRIDVPGLSLPQPLPRVANASAFEGFRVCVRTGLSSTVPAGLSLETEYLPSRPRASQRKMSPGFRSYRPSSWGRVFGHQAAFGFFFQRGGELL
jgi:hypothetical protein